VSTAFEQALAWEREMAADFYVRDTTLQDCADALVRAGITVEEYHRVKALVNECRRRQGVFGLVPPVVLEFYTGDTYPPEAEEYFVPGLPTAGWSAEAKAVLAAEADEG
jgi:hypothetical protein